MTEDRKLVEEYRAAWAEFHRSLEELQAAADRGNHRALEPLLVAVENARLNYNSARDRLAADMLHTDLAQIASGPMESRIRDAAHYLWELGGKRQGTAESDWLRAEALLRGQAAAG